MNNTVKRKRGWFQSAFDMNPPSPRPTETPPPENPSLRKSPIRNNTEITNKLNGAPSVPLKVKNFQSANWIENFAPTTLVDLAVHQKKIEDVQTWLNVVVENKRRRDIAPILLLTGPTGCGKTITIHLVAETLQYDVTSWTTPEDVDLPSYGSDKYPDGEGFTYRECQEDKFEEFLNRCSRTKSLFAKHSQRLILVKDFPNIFLKTPELFHQTLERYLEFGKCPLIFIVTDTNSKTLNIAYNLFPEAVRLKCQVDEVAFNSVSATLMKKALKRIVGLMTQPGYAKYYRAPSQDILDGIIMQADGDLRNAVINLHFSSSLNPVALKTEVSYAISENKKSKKPEKHTKLTSIGKDSNITMMHALGRVFYPKMVDNFNANATINDMQPKVFKHSPEEIAEQFTSQPSKFVAFLFANYPGYFSSEQHCAMAANTLSTVDMLLTDYRDEKLSEMGLYLAVRGLMVLNEVPAGGRRTIKGYKKLLATDANILKKGDSILTEYNSSLASASKLVALDYKGFIKIIQK